MGGWPPDPAKHAVRVRFTGVGGWAGKIAFTKCLMKYPIDIL